MTFDNKLSPTPILLLISITVLIIVFSWSGLFIVRKDTRFFVGQLNEFKGVIDKEGLENEGIYEPVIYRKMKPFYSVVGYILGGLSPQSVILILNIIFLFGLTFSSYYFFRLIDFDQELSLWGSAWVSMSYPMFKYGLALVTDISGWFFMTATLAVFFYALKKNSSKYLSLASIIGFLGSTAKETGVLGLVFAGLYILINYKEWGLVGAIKKLAFVSVPFLILFGLFSLWVKTLGLPSFLELYKYGFDIMFHDFYRLRYFLTNEFLSLHAVYLLSLMGFIYTITNKKYLDRRWIALLISALIPSLLILLWPVFYYRIMIIQFIFFVPLALYALQEINKKELKVFKINFVHYLAIIPPIVSIILFILIKKN